MRVRSCELHESRAANADADDIGDIRPCESAEGRGIDGALAVRSFPLAAALLSPKVTKGLVLVEPDTCRASYTGVQIDALASVPLLISSCSGSVSA